MKSSKKSSKTFGAVDSLYLWDEWFSHREFQLTEGLDFRCSPVSMAQQIRNAAVARQIQVSIKINGAVLDVTVQEEGGVV